LNNTLKPYLQRIDTHTSGMRCDVTPVFADAACFNQLVADLVRPFESVAVDFVVCIDALGFILGTAMACRLGLGIIPLRKGGKLPVATCGTEFQDYSGKTKRLEIRKDALSANARVLLVDEWIETGAQIQAAISLIEAQGAHIQGIAAINMDSNAATLAIGKKYQVHTVWRDAAADVPGRDSGGLCSAL